MSVPKKSAPSKAQVTGTSPRKSTASRRGHANRKKPTLTEPPDLDPIIDLFTDAYAVVWSASYVLRQSEDDDDEGFALSALRQGVAALGAVFDRLDEAEMQLHRFRERAGGAS